MRKNESFRIFSLYIQLSQERSEFTSIFTSLFTSILLGSYVLCTGQ
jgi:hypothetical protein